MKRKTRLITCWTLVAYLLATAGAAVFHHHPHEHALVDAGPKAGSAEGKGRHHASSSVCTHEHQHQHQHQHQRGAIANPSHDEHAPHDHKSHPIPSDHDDCLTCQFLAAKSLSLPPLILPPAAEVVEEIEIASAGACFSFISALPPARGPPRV